MIKPVFLASLHPVPHSFSLHQQLRLGLFNDKQSMLSLTMKDSFLEACEANNLSLVRDLLSRGADVNWRDNNGMFVLHIAASNNEGDLLELLLAQTGVDVNIRDDDNMTPLMWACCEGHDNIVRRLCQVTDIQLNNRDNIGGTRPHCNNAVWQPCACRVL